MPTRSELNLDWRALARQNLPGGMVDVGTRAAARQIQRRAQDIIVASGRVDTGALLRSIEVVRDDHSSKQVKWQVGSRLDYAIYQHEGVRGPIRPRNGRVLAIRLRGGMVIFRPRASGFAGIHFLTRAARETYLR